MRGIKNLVWISLVAIFVTAAITGAGIAPSVAVVYVDPKVSTGIKYDTFSVDIKVSEVNELFLTECSMDYDPAVLALSSYTLGDFDRFYVEDMDTAGIIHFVVGMFPGTKHGLNGSVLLLTAEFLIMDWGTSLLRLHDMDLMDVWGTHLDTVTFNGYFATASQLWIRTKGAHGCGLYFDWTTSKWYKGITNTLYAKISNTGDINQWVQVVFKVDEAGTPVDVMSNVAFVLAGDTVTVSADYMVPAAGKYTVRGDLRFYPQYEVDPTLWVRYADVQSVRGGEGESRVTGASSTFKC